MRNEQIGYQAPFGAIVLFATPVLRAGGGTGLVTTRVGRALGGEAGVGGSACACLGRRLCKFSKANAALLGNVVLDCVAGAGGSAQNRMGAAEGAAAASRTPYFC